MTDESSSNSPSRKKVTVRLRPADDEALHRAAGALFSGNLSRFIERALVELAYEQNIQPKPEGWRSPVPIPHAERLQTLADVERALKSTLKFQKAFAGDLKPPGRRGTAYHAKRQTYADLLTALRLFPQPAPSTPPPPSAETHGETRTTDTKVTVALTPEIYALVLELAGRMFPSNDRRASAAGDEGGANITALVGLAVRTKVDAVGMRLPGVNAPRLQHFPLPHLAGRYIEEHLFALTSSYRALATALDGKQLPPVVAAEAASAAAAFSDTLLAIRLA